MTFVVVQVKVIAAIELIVCVLLLLFNTKILFQITLPGEKMDMKDLPPGLSESAVIAFFLVRVIYLTGELVLAIVLNISAHKLNYNGMLLWFIITVTIILASRCYFIGGFIWGKYFNITLIIFSANLLFTFYSLISVYCCLKYLKETRGLQRRISQTNYYEMQKI